MKKILIVLLTLFSLFLQAQDPKPIPYNAKFLGYIKVRNDIIGNNKFLIQSVGGTDTTMYQSDTTKWNSLINSPNSSITISPVSAIYNSANSYIDGGQTNAIISGYYSKIDSGSVRSAIIGGSNVSIKGGSETVVINGNNDIDREDGATFLHQKIYIPDLTYDETQDTVLNINPHTGKVTLKIIDTSIDTTIYATTAMVTQQVTDTAKAIRPIIWSKNGNTLGSGGNTLGSKDNRSVRFLANNAERIKLDSATNTVLFAANSILKFSGQQTNQIYESGTSLHIGANTQIYFRQGSTAYLKMDNVRLTPQTSLGMDLGGTSFWNDLYIDDITGYGQSDFNIKMQSATARDEGYDIITRAGDAKTGTTNKAGGDNIISSGSSQGTGTSGIEFWTATAGSSGTGQNLPTKKWEIDGSGMMTGQANLFVQMPYGGIKSSITNDAITINTGNIGGIQILTGNTAYRASMSNGYYKLFTDTTGTGNLYSWNYSSNGFINYYNTTTNTNDFEINHGGGFNKLLVGGSTKSTHGYTSSIIKNLTNATNDTLFSISLYADSVANITISYGINATDGDTTQAEVGQLLLTAVNQNGSLLSSFTTGHSTQPTSMLGTLTKTLSVSLASNVLYAIINVNSSITPTSLVFKGTPDIHSSYQITKF